MKRMRPLFVGIVVVLLGLCIWGTAAYQKRHAEREAAYQRYARVNSVLTKTSKQIADSGTMYYSAYKALFAAGTKRVNFVTRELDPHFTDEGERHYLGMLQNEQRLTQRMIDAQTVLQNAQRKEDDAFADLYGDAAVQDLRNAHASYGEASGKTTTLLMRAVSNYITDAEVYLNSGTSENSTNSDTAALYRDSDLQNDEAARYGRDSLIAYKSLHTRFAEDLKALDAARKNFW
jgi:hypothetical protein